MPVHLHIKVLSVRSYLDDSKELAKRLDWIGSDWAGFGWVTLGRVGLGWVWFGWVGYIKW